MKTTLYIIGIIILAALGVAVYSIGKSQGTANSPVQNGAETTQLSEEAIQSMKVEAAKLAAAPFSETYENTDYGFSFKHPAGLIPSSFPNPESEGEIIVLSDNKTGVGMQILIAPFDEELTALTVERIKADMPDQVIIDSQDVLLGTEGKGVAFLDGTSDTSTRNVWFVARGSLYQITAPKPFDDVLKGILNSWVFQEI